MRKAAVIYTRVSTAEQVDNFSLGTQRKACEAYCHAHELTVDRVFEEQGESAKTIDRTELQALLTYCREHKSRIAYVVVYNVSRFSRNQEDHHVVRGLLRRLGISLRSASEQIDD